MAQAIEVLRWQQLKRWGLIVGEFSMAQMGVQIVTAFAGLLLVRSLPKPEYALFAIANSMQTTCNLLADVGIGIGVRSIGGRVWHDRFRFGQLLNTVLDLRYRFALVSFSVSLPLLAWMLWRNNASPFQIVALCLAIAASVIPLLGTTAWSASALLHGLYRRVQGLDFCNAALRLALIGLLVAVGVNAFLAVLVGVVGNWVQAAFLRRWAAEHADASAPTNAGDRAELISLSKRSLPNTVFFCFQGQVMLLILTVLGTPTAIANITALGRLAMFFTIFSVIFSNVLSPRFARCQDPAQLRRLYVLLLSGTIAVLFPLMALTLVMPGPFLWLLGDKYGGLERELGWIMGAACVGQVAGVMWSLNGSKAWIRAQAPSFIVIVVTAQIVAASLLDLRQLHDVLVFNLVTAAAPLPIYMLDAWLGMRPTHRPTLPAT